MKTMLPDDIERAVLVGRVWRNGVIDGPCVVAVRNGEVFDITGHAPTMSDLLERDDVLDIARSAPGESLGSVQQLMAHALESTTAAGAHIGMPRLLAPCDLQAIKACGVTFAVSLLERVIEEQAGGDASRANVLRGEIQAIIGSDLSAIRPGSPEAARLKADLIERGLWSPYMEVGIGPDAEVFSKSQPMSAVGQGADVGLHPDSKWNNPEPEIVLAVNSQARVLGATLGNDVNLRDIEGRSALLLGKAKDNNGSCAIGPFIRLFDEHFTIDTIRNAELSMLIEGMDDGFHLAGASRMREISRDPLDLVSQVCGRHHQYPDGFMLFLGTMFSPIKDRDTAGGGFTHHLGDRVSISTPSLGTLVNHVQRSDTITPWTFGVRALLARARGAASARAVPALQTRVQQAIYPSLAGKRVVITGGGSGIGAGMVEAFAQQGAQVHFLDIAEEDSLALQGRLSTQAVPPTFVRCDLTNLDAVAAAFERIGSVDVLINNAANDDRHKLADVSPEYWDERMAVNLRHQYFCAKAVAVGMQQRGGGVILNFGSISWHLALPELTLYMTAKAAIEGMTRGLARDLGPHNVRVNCIIPGAVRTPRQEALWHTPEEEARILAGQCLPQRVQVDDVAALALFLASDNAGRCTGRDYFVDAGWYGA
ncbi:SDR family oxidoreductase [Duganella violaceipulchra]|uniref:Fumarylacetoacetate (FAA) hydrolase family protein/NAD(P)-dependent dehydrogenase (Short-subunit alcohol dehydrogenase family) n=1 Tax=Duganella violaceipulchra TaxID=2849652 RepID=A0AA41HJM6_9BURK|nr:SDR family oxidoreductase [Duganella violaceicalia]MBV6325073.1 SDR family oxidoreductase [Duganella violaceicalia]MCP2010585.1 fumarylacetoacetate (FAA) hydrolase family protein/NAD(P)-dependent dehydrogenase (short-subunit alcohol dehydrogenase family) [Duganella violaceicalia]